jgi:predicted O-linked N-acetylglucosamine transferase (SPINDLY family)
LPKLSKTRSHFQLREEAIVYLCCQSLFKYLPQYDFIFAEIAQRCPQAQFVFVSGFNSLLTQQFDQRLQRAFASLGLDASDYCVILSRQEQEDYWQLNLLSDVFLDTLSWSGGNTTLEAIACGLPVVTCPGEFMRGRHSYAILQCLNTPETIAQTINEYIEIAVKLGKDSHWRSQTIQKMRKYHHQLYDDSACVIALENFYQQVVNARLSQ